MIRATVFLFLAVLSGCTTMPAADSLHDDASYLGATNAAAHFRNDERLTRYFDDAVAYAMFPRVYRAGAGYGLAYGSGWVFDH